MRAHLHGLVLLAIDIALIAAASVFALILRDNFELSPAHLEQSLPYIGATLLAAVFILPIFGLNRTIWRFSGLSDYLRIAGACVMVVLAALAVTFLLARLEGIARSLPVLQALLMTVLLIGVRVTIRSRHIRRGSQTASAGVVNGDHAVETVLLVGLTPITDLFLRSVAEFAQGRLRIAGIVGRNERQRGRHLHQCPVLGTPEEVERILNDLEVHGVVINRIIVMMNFSDLSPAARQALLQVEKDSSIKLEFLAERLSIADYGKSSHSASSLQPPSDLAYSSIELEACARRQYFSAKRLVDFIVAATLLVVAMPVMILIAVAVAVDVGFPVLFWQQRPGLLGRPFRLYKFRTMRAAHDEAGERVPDSERLSLIGRSLRRTRLDELPQVYNILVGDMSFIGPRPLLPIDQHPEFAARLLIRPGLTGWAQVAGGREISARDKAALDIWYVRNASLATDARVLAQTLPMLVLGERPNQSAIGEAWNELRELAAKSKPSAVIGFIPSMVQDSRRDPRMSASMN